MSDDEKKATPIRGGELDLDPDYHAGKLARRDELEALDKRLDDLAATLGGRVDDIESRAELGARLEALEQRLTFVEGALEGLRDGAAGEGGP
jgi:hypothetical protein